MHSHYGMQEQHLLAAPLVIWSEQERAQAEQLLAAGEDGGGHGDSQLQPLIT